MVIRIADTNAFFVINKPQNNGSCCFLDLFFGPGSKGRYRITHEEKALCLNNGHSGEVRNVYVVAYHEEIPLNVSNALFAFPCNPQELV
jgi:hypothetical protein